MFFEYIFFRDCTNVHFGDVTIMIRKSGVPRLLIKEKRHLHYFFDILNVSLNKRL